MASQVVIRILTQDFSKAGFAKGSENVKQLEKAVDKANQRLKTMAILAAGVATVAVAKFAKFDTGIREISTLITNVTEQDIKTMGSEIKKTSIDFGQSVDKMTKARYDIISAGFTGIKDSATLMSQSAKLAVAGVSDVSKTADVLTTVLNAYGEKADKAQKISDVLFTTVRLGKTTVDELASSFGNAASIAPQLGIAVEEVAAGIATLTARGIRTDEAVTSLQASFVSLLKPSQELQTRLNEIGYETSQAAIASLGFAGVLQKLTEGQTQADLAAFFPNVRAMKAVFPLSGVAADKFRSNLEELNAAAGATDIAFNKVADSLGQRLKKAQARIEVAMIGIGESFAPIAEGGAKVLEFIDGMGTSGARMLATVIPLTAALWAFNGVILALGGPLTLIAGAVGIAVVGFMQSIKTPAEQATIAVDEFTRSLENMSLTEKMIRQSQLKQELEEAKEILGDLAVTSTGLWGGIVRGATAAVGALSPIDKNLEEQGAVVDMLKGKYKALTAEIEALAVVSTAPDGSSTPSSTPSPGVPKGIVTDPILTDQIMNQEDEIIQEHTDERLQKQIDFNSAMSELRLEAYGTWQEQEIAAYEQRLSNIDQYWQNNEELMRLHRNKEQQILNESIAAEKQALQQKSIAWKLGASVYDQFTRNLIKSDNVYLNTTLNILADILKEYIATEIARKAVMSSGIATAIVAGSAAGSALAAAYGPAATFASIMTFGGAAAAGEAGIITALATTKGLSVIGTAQQGGIVPNIDSGLSIGTDKTAMLLTPGEAVISRPVVQQNPQIVDSLLSGKGSTSNQQITIAPNFYIQALDTIGFEETINSSKFKDTFINMINDNKIILKAGDVSVKGQR